MKIFGQQLPGVEVINRTLYHDDRGYFSEAWKNHSDKMRGDFRQLNVAKSKKNVLRGMHRQNQSKLVMPVYGTIFDVALDPVTGKWFGVVLDESTALFIPPEYAHGYVVLSDMSIVEYIVDMPYSKSEEENFNWNGYGIEWPITEAPILSGKDSHENRL